MKKILVTGSLGLVGSACVRFFSQENWKVVGIDNNQRSKMFGTEEVAPDSVTSNVDITNKKEVFSLFEKEGGFDAIIHAAAQPSHDYATDHALIDFDINARGTIILLEATRQICPQAVFVHVSTDKVYGENMERMVLVEQPTRYHNRHPFKEDIPLHDAGIRSLFGCSKLAADLYAQEYAKKFKMKIGIFRPGCITGRDHRGAERHGFLAYLAKCIKEGQEYKIFGFKGKQVRDQIHAHDLACVFSHFIQKPQPGAIYNIGGGPERSISVLEAIKAIEAKTGKRCDYVFRDAREGDRIWDVHDVSKFKHDYPNWDYQYSLDDIISELCTS